MPPLRSSYACTFQVKRAVEMYPDSWSMKEKMIGIFDHAFACSSLRMAACVPAHACAKSHAALSSCFNVILSPTGAPRSRPRRPRTPPCRSTCITFPLFLKASLRGPLLTWAPFTALSLCESCFVWGAKVLFFLGIVHADASVAAHPLSSLPPPRLLFPPQGRLSEREAQVSHAARFPCHHPLAPVPPLSPLPLLSLLQMGKRMRRFWIDFIHKGEEDHDALSADMPDST